MAGFIIEKVLEVAKEKGLSFAKEKWFENKIKEEITTFDLDFEREVLDCNSFELFLRENNNINKIFEFTYGSFNNKYKSDAEFINEISNEAYNYFNYHKEKIGNIKTDNKDVFYKYFERLIKIINELIFEKLSPESKSIVKLVNKSFSGQNERILNLLEEIKNSQKELNINVSENEMINSLKSSGLNFTEEKRIKIANGQNIKGEVTVKYDESISKFKNVSELQRYVYFTQKPLNLDLISFKLISGENVIEELLIESNYNGPITKLNFISKGEIELLKKSISDSSSKGKVRATLSITPVKEKDKFRINLEDDNYNIVLSNIDLSIEERKMVGKNLVAVLSNKEQEDSLLYIKFIVTFDSKFIMNTRVEIIPRKKELAIYHLEKFNLFLKLKSNNSKRLIGRIIDNCEILFEGNFNVEYDDEMLAREIEFVKNVIYIQDKVNIKIDLSKEFTDEDIDEISKLKEIINTGKIELRDRIITAKINEIFNLSNLLPGKEIAFTFKSDEKYEIFGHEVDLGTLLYVYSKVKIKSINKETFIGETIEGTKKLCISPKYYGDFTFEEICEREGLN